MDNELEPLRSAFSGRYEIAERIGAGGMGAVYAAADRRHGRRVAIKVIHPQIADGLNTSRFLREISIAAVLQHPNIVPLFDSGETDGLLYYVMPLVAGESLRTRIDREKQLPIADICRITTQVASALACAHQNGIIHRDVKPHNILLSHGQAVVTDFGIAKIAEPLAGSSTGAESLTRTGTVLGSPAYMSPEQAAGGDAVDERSDQYALACVVFEMLTGTLPFTAPTVQALVARHLLESPPTTRVVRPTVTARADHVLGTALAKMPADRYATIAKFAEELEASLAAAVKPESSAPDQASPSRSAIGTAPAPRGMNAGRFVSKTCNRWSQVNAFDARIREYHRRFPRRPHVFIVHGDEGQAHDSLVERLASTSISRFAESIAGVESAAIAQVHAPWPVIEDLDVAKRDLAVALFREAAPRYMGDELTADAFLRCVGERLAPVAVVQHDIRARYWHRNTGAIVDWYVNRFWGEAEARRVDPQVFVFLKIIYPVAAGGALSRALLALNNPRQRVARALVSIRPDEARCGWTLFDELAPVSADDVKDWLAKNHILESEQQREAQVSMLFRRSPRRRMVDVEPLLAELHRTALESRPLSTLTS